MIGNVLIAPNSFLQAYRSITFAVKVDNYFSFELGSFFGSAPNDNTFAQDIVFYNSDADATANGSDLTGRMENILRDVTKKAYIRFNKHPSVPSQDYIANYSIGNDMAIPTFLGATPLPLNALAKDGDEFEIYGVDEIRKFFSSPLHISLNPVPYLLTVILFK